MSMTGTRILVVDDNPTNLKLAADVLTHERCQVLTAADAEEAAEILKHERPHLILMDIALPGMDGLTFTRKLKADPVTRGITIVALTAFAMKGDEEKAREAGCDGYITKPVDTRQLAEQVRMHLRLEESAKKKRRLLVVDDVPANRKLLRAELENAGFDVQEAPDGQVALALLERHPVDAVISDILMPVMDGYRLCYLLRQDGRFRKLPFIFYSNTYQSPADEKLALEMGGDLFLTKPASAPDILRALEKVMGEERREHKPLTVPEELWATRLYNERLVAKLEERNVELWEKADELRRQMRERQAALEALRATEDQLRQAQKMEAVGRLASGVAHDFNNLVMIIASYTHLICKVTQPQSSVRHHAEQILEAAERAAAVTARLLSFSRKQPIDVQVLRPSDVLVQMAKLLQRLVAGVEVQVSARATGAVRVDRCQLEQILMNLATNARDAMPQGGRITLETCDLEADEDYTRQHPGVQPGSYVVLRVSDTGCGMSAELQAQVFEPFFTTKEIGKGTGLGLSMVYGAVKQSGGHLELRSVPGQGSSFEILLPRTADCATATETTESAGAVAGNGETVLLVEDEELLRTVEKDFLETAGYKVLMAANGEDALALCAQHPGPIDVLVTDVVMPRLGGFELAIRLTKIYPEMAVLYASGDINRSFGDPQVPGVTLAKPFSLGLLSAKIGEILQTKALAARKLGLRSSALPNAAATA